MKVTQQEWLDHIMKERKKSKREDFHVLVESSNIASVGISGDYMIVKFKSGASYSYKDVPAKVFVELVEAESVGKYFNKNIKGSYEYKKIEPNV